MRYKAKKTKRLGPFRKFAAMGFAVSIANTIKGAIQSNIGWYSFYIALSFALLTFILEIISKYTSEIVNVA